jgi:lysozyme
MAGKTKGVAGLVGAAAVAFGLYVGTLQVREGTRYEAYQDSLGIWTICTGDTNDVRAGMIETPEGCHERLERTARFAWDYVQRVAPEGITWGQQRAYSDYAFNAGVGSFSKSTMLFHARNGNLQASCDAFLDYMKAGGRDCRIKANNCGGIVIRRQQERRICLGGES